MPAANRGDPVLPSRPERTSRCAGIARSVPLRPAGRVVAGPAANAVTRGRAPAARTRPAPARHTARRPGRALSRGSFPASFAGLCQMTPCASIASATRSKPAMFAPVT
ncbi:hypothetical protein GCM10010421_03760 [Streptomyces glaucus]|uniref:Secreted protein n=1 Tax=Streptomyces glaucus TaxID=284029 RepID=A0ABN3J5J0_9ACTN